ncbi:tetratricopeptide repeat protein [Amphritea sp.]|uniref:L,D-transpeptidase Cds6 family protein n=1 Tax=Amphritea sp. TaxID=1872502 RepID=UPI0025B89D41|nr:tetratricopeptide repeat protein [Amphritea sp.]
MTNNGKNYMRTAITRKLTLALAIGLLTGSMTVSAAGQPEIFCQSAGSKNDYDCTKKPDFQANQADIDSRLNALNNWLEDEERALSTPLVSAENPDSEKLRKKIEFNSQLLATELKLSKKLQRKGDLKGAFDKVNSYLASNPKDPNGWLLYGISLINQNKLDEAADVFSRLVQLYPESPEPYNNLAVVHARKGENDKAVEVLLQAFETHPSYAQVQTNLKAVYATLATQAYNRALNLDSTTQSRRANLGILDQVYNPAPTQIIIASSEQTPAKPPSVVSSEAAIKTLEKQPSELIIEERQVSEGRVPAFQVVTTEANTTIEAPKIETAPVAAPKIETAPTTAPAVVASADTPEQSEVQTTSATEIGDTPLLSDKVRSELQQLITNWASSWSAQNVEAYLDFYTGEYSPDPQVTHKQWEWGRHKRISKPAFIKIEVSDISLAEAGNGRVRSVFSQTYQSDTYQDKVYKTLILALENGQWKITTESTL